VSDLERLWACHECKMIGTPVEGKAHRLARGHDVVELSDEESQGVRELWMRDQAKRAAGFALAARRRGPFDAIARLIEAEDES
jgi:hypothetical protein